jgi:hypothetical protein
MTLPPRWFLSNGESGSPARYRDLLGGRQTAANLTVKIRVARRRGPSKISSAVRILICSGHRS